MEQISLGEFLKITENLPYEDIKSLCRTSKKFLRFCRVHKNHLWKHKIRHDFNLDYNWERVNIDPEKAYRNIKEFSDLIKSENQDNYDINWAITRRNFPAVIWLSSLDENVVQKIRTNMIDEFYYDVNIVDYLVEKGVIDPREKDGIAILYAKNIEMFDHLVNKYGLDPHFGKDEVMSTAAARGDINYIEHLVDFGLNPNSNDDDPLIWAVENGQYEAAKHLMYKYGADPNAKGLKHVSDVASHLAYVNLDFLKHLLKNGFILSNPTFNIDGDDPVQELDLTLFAFFYIIYPFIKLDLVYKYAEILGKYMDLDNRESDYDKYIKLFYNYEDLNQNQLIKTFKNVEYFLDEVLYNLNNSIYESLTSILKDKILTIPEVMARYGNNPDIKRNLMRYIADNFGEYHNSFLNFLDPTDFLKFIKICYNCGKKDKQKWLLLLTSAY